MEDNADKYFLGRFGTKYIIDVVLLCLGLLNVTTNKQNCNCNVKNNYSILMFYVSAASKYSTI